MSTDFTWHCNALKCRTVLQNRAVVTTCSHIFCLTCAETQGLASSNNGVRICPACNTQLVNQDDAIITQLDPSEDYKTSVLSGMHPSIIMECAGRGLAFYTYQVSNEITYQTYLAASLTDKYSQVNNQLDTIITQANGQIKKLQDALKGAS
ncbi:hypothetical protein EJ08DRAFT_591675 [Tothia fuscella]|uniref:RING-type domain-containing protein n=1 Tax=Tothia fuscella TaxID=1048955 RepID=A0A9P4NN23_9PEZI|nr:hypothetical protein EJ08DRAFT_591675 [Tothia fuscella]